MTLSGPDVPQTVHEGTVLPEAAVASDTLPELQRMEFACCPASLLSPEDTSSQARQTQVLTQYIVPSTIV